MTAAAEQIEPCPKGHPRKRGRSSLYCPTCLSLQAKAAENWKRSAPWTVQQRTYLTPLVVATVQSWVLARIGFRPVLVREPLPDGRFRALLRFSDGAVQYQAEVARLYALRRSDPKASSARLLSVFVAL